VARTLRGKSSVWTDPKSTTLKRVAGPSLWSIRLAAFLRSSMASSFMLHDRSSTSTISVVVVVTGVVTVGKEALSSPNWG